MLTYEWGDTMDKILSARIDDAVFRTITDLSQKMHSSKKAVIEKAINLLRENVDQCKGTDVFDDTIGAWKRDENPEDTIAQARTLFEKSMTRHHR
jgi:hypothetical protein